MGDHVLGIGQIQIVFQTNGTVTSETLRFITLMDGRLQFEYVHGGFAGPLTFRLYRVE